MCFSKQTCAATIFYLQDNGLIFLFHFSVFVFFSLQSGAPGRGTKFIHRAWNFNEHAMGRCMLFPKAHVTNKERMNKEIKHFKEMTKTLLNEDVFQNKVAEHVVEDAAMLPVYYPVLLRKHSWLLSLSK